MPLVIKKTFRSSAIIAQAPATTLHVNLWPHIPQVELWTEEDGGRVGPSVVLKGEDLGKFIAWMKEQDFHG